MFHILDSCMSFYMVLPFRRSHELFSLLCALIFPESPFPSGKCCLFSEISRMHIFSQYTMLLCAQMFKVNRSSSPFSHFYMQYWSSRKTDILGVSLIIPWYSAALWSASVAHRRAGIAFLCQQGAHLLLSHYQTIFLS